MLKHFQVDELDVYVHEDRERMGKAAAALGGEALRKIITEKGEVNVIFASSPSQDTLLEALSKEPAIDWGRVNAFHMDEYIGVSENQPQSFANYLKMDFFSKVKFKEVFYINGMAENPESECERYSDLIMKHPTDVAFLGIGENGHIAFNDPHIANFFDPRLVIINDSLDEKCREQQVADGWFPSVADVPGSAITVSVYGLLKAAYVFTIVPGIRKSKIVKTCLEESIGNACPSSGIRVHRNAKLFLDRDSASLLSEGS